MSGDKYTEKKLQLLKQKKKEENNRELILTLFLTDILTADSLYIILEELIKYSLFMRFQIPTPYSMLVGEVKARQTELDALTGSKCGHTRNKRLLGKKKFVDSTERIFGNLKIITRQTTVRKVVLLFGSTAVSPKETIVIDTNTDVKASGFHSSIHTNKLSGKTDEKSDRTSTSRSGLSNEKQDRITARKVMRDVVTDSRLVNLKSLNPANIILLLNTDDPLEEDFSEIFTPKLNFSLSKRGYFYHFKLDYKDDIKLNSQPQRESVDKPSSPSATTIDGSPSYTVNGGSGFSIASDNDSLVDDFNRMDISDDVLEEENFETYWYHCKIPLKGFKEPNSTEQKGTSWM